MSEIENNGVKCNCFLFLLNSFSFLLPKEDESLAENGSGASGLWGGAVTLSGFLPINLPRWHCVSVHLCLGGTALCHLSHSPLCYGLHLGTMVGTVPHYLLLLQLYLVELFFFYPVAVPAFFSLYTESIESILQHWMSVEQCGAV